VLKRLAAGPLPHLPACPACLRLRLTPALPSHQHAITATHHPCHSPFALAHAGHYLIPISSSPPLFRFPPSLALSHPLCGLPLLLGWPWQNFLRDLFLHNVDIAVSGRPRHEGDLRIYAQYIQVMQPCR